MQEAEGTGQSQWSLEMELETVFRERPSPADNALR